MGPVPVLELIIEPGEGRATVSEGRRYGWVDWVGRPLMLEARRPFELRALRRSPLWWGEGLPAGEGRPALVIPGFLAGRQTADPLAHVLRAAGWRVEVAGVGRNYGPAYEGVDRSTEDLLRLEAETGEPVRVIGHSRGGQYARVLAVRHPSSVGQVIAVGTPLTVKYPPFAVVRVPAEVLDRSHRAGHFGPVDVDREQEVDDHRYVPFPGGIDFVSVWSRTDGIVDWRLCREPAAADIEVSASHLGLLASIAGITGIARALDRDLQ